MKANELRIGNWVQVDDLPPEQITLETLKTIAENPATFYKFNPIPLTPEILWDLGFVKDGEYLKLKLNKARIELLCYQSNPKQICIFQDGKIIDLAWGAASHVHQLQNLYFALTGVELTINLKEKV